MSSGRVNTPNVTADERRRPDIGDLRLQLLFAPASAELERQAQELAAEIERLGACARSRQLLEQLRDVMRGL
jgi:hypothetical protein